MRALQPHIHIQERLGDALHMLARLEQQAATAPDSRNLQRLLKQCRRLVDDLERGFSLLQEAASQHAQLSQQVEAASTRAGVLFDLSPLPCVIVHETGAIDSANAAATRLLNTSSRYLQEKSFELFLGSDRDGFLGWLRAVSNGSGSERREALLRPREQRPKPVVLVATPEMQGRVALVLMGPEESAIASAPAATAEMEMHPS